MDRIARALYRAMHRELPARHAAPTSVLQDPPLPFSIGGYAAILMLSFCSVPLFQAFLG